MPNSDLQQIHDALGAFLSGRISLDDFRDRAIPAVYLYDDRANWSAQSLVYFLIARFAEDDDGLWTESALQDHLRSYLQAEWPELYADLLSAVTMEAIADEPRVEATSPTVSQTFLKSVQQASQWLRWPQSPQSSQISEEATFGRPSPRPRRARSHRLRARFLTARG